jgi:hypothetical protein
MCGYGNIFMKKTVKIAENVIYSTYRSFAKEEKDLIVFLVIDKYT